MKNFGWNLLLEIVKQPLVIVLLIIGILCRFFYKTIIGKAGEHWVREVLSKLEIAKYLILNDLMIKTKDGLTYQIDHIVISKYGIFVIETKQYNGYITGNEYDKKWKQNRKYYINNPIHQNYGHIKALEEILDLPEDKFINIVCIPSKAKLNIKSDKIARYYDLKEKIEEYDKKIIDDPSKYYNKLNECNIKNPKARKEHVRQVKNTIVIKSEVEKNMCPKCGAILIEKEGKYGKFYGCSNYPKCKYTKNK